MTKLFCKSCGCSFIVSELKIAMSDNDWFYCPDCGSGNVKYVDEGETFKEK